MGLPSPRLLFAAPVFYFTSLCPVGAEDVITLKDGVVRQGQVVELGGNRIDLVVKGGLVKILKRDIDKVAFDPHRSRKDTLGIDGVLKRGGHVIQGTVELLKDGQEVLVTIPGGGHVRIPRVDVLRVLKSGDSIENDGTIHTVELKEAIEAALGRLRGPPDEAAKAKAFLARSGIFAIDRVREAALKAPPGFGEAKALEELIRLYSLKQIVATEIEERENRIYEILQEGTTVEKCDLLVFIFPRFVDESVPIAEFLAREQTQDPVVRGWSVDFLRRMQKNRELLGIYKRSTGQIQLAAAIALGQNGILIGVPALIECIGFDSLELRTLAHEHLRDLTTKDFKFRPDGAPAARREAAARWRAWWQENETAITHAAESILRNDNDATPERRAAAGLWKAAAAEEEAGHFEKAEALFRDAIDQDPTLFQAQIGLAILLYSELGRPGEAVRRLKEMKTKRLAAVRREERQWILLHLGHALRLAGSLEEAVRAYEDTRSLAPKNLQALVGLGDASFRLATSGKDLKPEARKDLLRSSLGAYRAALGVIETLNERLVTLRFDKSALDGNPPFDRREYNRSVLDLRRRFRRQKLEISLEIAKIQSLEADRKEAMLTLKTAIGAASSLPDVDPESKALEASMRCHLGILYEQVGQPVLALKEFRKVLADLDPKHAETLLGVERIRRHARTQAGN